MNSVSEILEAADLYMQAGNFAKAIENYQKALEEEPTNVDIYNALGLVMLSIRQNDMAKQLFLTASTLAPESSHCYRNLGLVNYALNDKRTAIKSFEKALKHNPDNGDALLNLGQIYKNDNNLQLARQYFERAIIAKKIDPVPLAELSEILSQEHEHARAAEAAKAALSLQPQNIQALRTMTTSYRYLSNPLEAIRYGTQLVKLTPNDSSNHVSLAKAYIEYGKHRVGCEYARKAILLDDQSAEAYACYSAGITHAGKWVEALEHIEKALALSPQNDRFIAHKARLLRLMGRKKESFDLVAPLVQGRKTLNTDSLQIYLYNAGSFGEEAKALEIAESVLGMENLPNTIRLSLSFAVGHLYDSLGKYDDAFKHFSRGNDLKHLSYDHVEQERKVEHILANFTEDLLQKLPRATHRSRQPIFIVGMPRSGTSLTEKILASHSQVFGAGELTEIGDICQDLPAPGQSGHAYPACMHDITQESMDKAAARYLDFVHSLDDAGHPRITDKMPQNFNYLGIIAAMFPDSPIIHCKRSALDTCLSCYFQNFSSAGLEFSYDLADLGQYYKLYEKIMDHWQKVLPDRIYNLSYEALVENPEEETRKLVAFCGLDWEDACLAHHKSQHVSKTASFDQVRQPIYKKSRGRWENYEKHLKPLMDVLKKQ